MAKPMEEEIVIQDENKQELEKDEKDGTVEEVKEGVEIDKEQTKKEDFRKKHIESKFVYEKYIPKEVFKLYPDLTEKEISQQVNKVCFLTEIEKPKKQNLGLFQVYSINDEERFEKHKSIIREKERAIIYRNYPETYDLDLKTFTQLENTSVRFWKPPEIKELNKRLKTIEMLYFKMKRRKYKNYKVFKAFIDNRLINLIVINQTEFCVAINNKGRKLMGEFEELEKDQFGELLNQIEEALCESKIDFKKDTEVMLVKNETFEQLKEGRYSEYGDFESSKRLAVITFGNYKDGIIVEYTREDANVLKGMKNVYLIKNTEEIEQKIGNKRSKKYKMKDLRTPINKTVIIAKPKHLPKSLYDPKTKSFKNDFTSMCVVGKYLNEIDLDKLNELYPRILQMQVIYNTNVNINARRKLAEKIFNELDKKRKEKEEKKE